MINIKTTILDFYQNLYTKKEQWRPTATFEDLASLTMEQKEWLERAFEEDEILATINSCAPNKAPGPDGYTMAFYQKTWDFIKTDVLGAMHHFH